MLLKSIKLNNIRSYLDQKIDFPIGSLLLSGDIGSGKSTILLGIEFALFGSKPSELPASSLLRHGKKEGSVELNFELEGKDILIKRNLKRGKEAIKQETGYIIINGIKKELSPVEMKSQIFDLLGYPKDLVAKGKDLIYRYTVYTPQEEMKRILIEDKDTRLNTLRKVFNIDKYKKIRENTSIFIRSIKEKRKEFEGFISDLEEKKKELDSINKEMYNLEEKIKNIMPKVEKAKNEVGRKREKISVYENKVNELNKLKNDLNICDVDLDNSLNEHNRNNRQILMLNEQIIELEKDLVKEIKDGELKGEISKTEIRVKDMQNEMDSIRQKLNEFNIKKSNAEEIINKISEIEKCPLCLQNVEHDHKSAITEREDKNIKDYEQNMRLISVKETETKNLMDSLQNELEILRKKENSMELMKLKLKNAKEKREEKQNLEKLQVDKKKKIGEINAEKIELNKKIGEIKNVEEDYKIVKTQLDMALEEEKKFDIEKARMDKENESLNRVVKNLGEEVDKKSKAKEKLNYFVDVQNWLENYFVNLMSTMEKHIMLQVYREFNELFKTWFNILIEDETISVRLDDEFTPIIEQNGYDTNVDSLSGGEKTSVALSYRLALNKVINDIVSGIKTKDILMLDEPTDGFSSEQLDKVRDVLEQLNIKQIIIVSHESKIESFVDSVIRIGKEEHVSLIY